MIKSSDFELITKIKQEYSAAWEANKWDQEILIKCWRMYMGAPGEQWDDDELAQKDEREERVAQYNIIKNKIATFVGMLIADEYDFKYDPITGVRTSGVEALEMAYYCDKELCNYDYHYGLVVEDGCVHRGILEVKVKKDWDYRGNICFERAIPGRWVTDPYWKSDDDRDCENAWKQGHLTVDKMIEIYKNLPSSPRLDSELKMLEKQGMDWTEASIGEYGYPEPKFKNAFHIVESHWVETINKKRLVARNDVGMWIPFPVTEDNEELEMFAMQNGITDWKEGSAHVTPYKDKIHWSATICPELFPYKFLERGRPEVQIKGLPIIQFTTKRDISGRNFGKVNDLIDIQKDLNYAQSKIWEILANQMGGGLVYDKRRMSDESKQEDFEKNHNDPTRAWGLEGPVEGFTGRLVNGQANNELVRKTSEPFDYADRISGVSAAMSSQTENSGEPASLFAMKLKVNKIGQLTVDRRVKTLRERMAEAYFYQAQITYAGEERIFTSKDGKKACCLNEELPNGTIRNKVNEVPRCSVSITESPNNLSKQLRDRAELAEILKSMPQQYAEAFAIGYGELFQTTSISEEKKTLINDALTLEQIKARLASIAQIAQAETVTKQSNLQSIQIGAQIEKANAMLNQMGQQPETPEMISQGEQEISGQGTPQEISPQTENLPQPGSEATQPIEAIPNQESL
jgi:hypothetical protein